MNIFPMLLKKSDSSFETATHIPDGGSSFLNRFIIPPKKSLTFAEVLSSINPLISGVSRHFTVFVSSSTFAQSNLLEQAASLNDCAGASSSSSSSKVMLFELGVGCPD